MHVHLEPVGGLAGDMFVAAMLDAWPALLDDVVTTLDALRLGGSASVDLLEHHDGTLGGRRFSVDGATDEAPHRTHRDIVELIRRAERLPADVRDRAIDIFTLLADAEAAIHAVARDDVTFHEIGALDSIVDVVAAATVIERSGVASWSIAPLPLGGGTVTTAHGELPVPAPATLMLLDLLQVVDDGITGERITPTGAAIVRALQPEPQRPRTPQIIAAVGTGFGTRVLPGRSNILRLTAMRPAPTTSSGSTSLDHVGIVELDVDDQSAEDLAVGLDHIRALAGVVDVIQRPAFGKKGRIVTEVRVMCDPAVIDVVVTTCLLETTSIGVRRSIVERVVLDRTASAPDGLRLKTAHRPDGKETVKVEIDDLADAGDHVDRQRLRRRVELLGDGR